MQERRLLDRRSFLGMAAGTAALAAAAPVQAAHRIGIARSLAFENLHTGETLKTVYWADGHYDPAGMRRINHLLRDFRTEQIHQIDPRLLDLLSALQSRLRTRAPYQVISGYRSPATNAMLASFTDGVVPNSLHTQGMAIDIRVPGRSLRDVRRAAASLRAGGVGYYPQSDFVHVDVGRVRYW
ncbi:MAG TPA: DUF882 domain-containing protein [Stellaceae bacterium]|jgi:uncharacterized protein YcbK (DUF882 family)